jgi:NADH:ubiquinone oxidoreductase subunit F (NADH-binding)
MQGNANYDRPPTTGNESDDLSTLESAQRSQLGDMKCKIHHTEDIKAFCKDDLCSICFKCLLGEHRNHDIVMLEELSVADL